MTVLLSDHPLPEGERAITDPTEDRMAHLLKLAAKATARAFSDRLAEEGVSYGHWTFLRVLWKEDGLTVTELARRAAVAKPAAVMAIHGMERLGYVERHQRDGNLKAVYIHLTPAGRALEPKLIPLAVEINDRALTGLSERQQQAFRKMLTTVIRNLEGGS